MISYFAVLVIGILLGRLFADKELRRKLHNKFFRKNPREEAAKQEQKRVCTTCKDHRFVYDTELNKQIICPRCNGTGIEPN